jgi:hypothetical protein
MGRRILGRRIRSIFSRRISGTRSPAITARYLPSPVPIGPRRRRVRPNDPRPVGQAIACEFGRTSLTLGAADASVVPPSTLRLLPPRALACGGEGWGRGPGSQTQNRAESSDKNKSRTVTKRTLVRVRSESRDHRWQDGMEQIPIMRPRIAGAWMSAQIRSHQMEPTDAPGVLLLIFPRSDVTTTLRPARDTTA